MGHPGRAVLVHRRLPRAGPRRQPAAAGLPHRRLGDGRDHRRRRLLLHPRGAGRGVHAGVEAGRVQARQPALTGTAGTAPGHHDDGGHPTQVPAVGVRPPCHPPRLPAPRRSRRKIHLIRAGRASLSSISRLEAWVAGVSRLADGPRGAGLAHGAPPQARAGHRDAHPGLIRGGDRMTTGPGAEPRNRIRSRPGPCPSS
ncbi:hypothetical protein MICRO11B_160054 [Micrococcus luteus]|nr:hypothetical protein MICRO11B_160054 [Micrococcus luteus]